MGSWPSTVKEQKDRSYLTGDSGLRERIDAVAFGTGTVDYSLWVELNFACTNLINKDVLSLSDPFAVLFKHTGQRFEEVGRTEIIANNLNPRFVRSFQVLYEFERLQKFQVKVYDADQDRNVEELVLDAQDFLGSVELVLSDLVAETEGKAELDMVDAKGSPLSNSKLIVYYEEQTNQSDEVKIAVEAKLVTTRPPQAFYVISKRHSDGVWIPVYRSEVLKPPGSDAPYPWKPLESRLRALCNANLSRPMLFEVLKYRYNGTHQLIGKTVLSMEDVEGLKEGGRASLHRSPIAQYVIPVGTADLTVDGKAERTGHLKITGYERRAAPSFLEYISAGYEICFLVAIDFTRSNGLPELPGSLHHVLTDTMDGDRRLNVYEEAIYGVGRILESYDSDKLFPTWGFGAKLPGEENVVSHCFAVNGDDSAPECQGVKGILKEYRSDFAAMSVCPNENRPVSFREALNRVTLAGPTFFSPIFKAASTMASHDAHHKYYCLLVVTDGVLLDMPRVKREIIAASRLPLSIMLVGVGEEDFSKMVELDSDDTLLSEGGVEAERDIVQFVEFNKYKNKGEGLARELLAEFPGQFLSYMKANNITPENVAKSRRKEAR